MSVRRHYLWVLLTMLMVVVLCPLPAGWSAGWRGELTNRIHAPLMAAFGFLAGICLGSGGRRHAVLLTLIAAMAIELVQPWFGRTASLGDLGWGMIGALSVMIWQRWRLAWLALLVALAAPVSWWVQLTLARQEAARRFPILLAPESSGLLWQTSPAFAGKIVLERNNEQPASARLEVMRQDWSAFSGLELEGELTAPDKLPLGLRLDLADASRIRLAAELQPGENHLRIFWPEGTKPAQVKQLVLFLEAGTPPAKLRMRSLRLIEQGRKEHPR